MSFFPCEFLLSYFLFLCRMIFPSLPSPLSSLFLFLFFFFVFIEILPRVHSIRMYHVKYHRNNEEYEEIRQIRKHVIYYISIENGALPYLVLTAKTTFTKQSIIIFRQSLNRSG